MLRERLTPCATLLYHWLSNYTAARRVDLKNFQVWSEEFLEERFSVKDVDKAFLRLLQLGLLRVENDRITAKPIEHKNSSIRLRPLPKKLLKVWHLEDRLAMGGLAIASTVLLAVSGFVLTQGPVQSQSVTGSLDAMSEVVRPELDAE